MVRARGVGRTRWWTHAVEVEGARRAPLPGAYFITLVTYQRACLFGEIVDGVVRLSPIGIVIDTEWRQMGSRFPNIRFDAFVVMPNHLHGIILIDPAVGATHPLPGQ